MNQRTNLLIFLGISSIVITVAIVGIWKYVEFRKKHETAYEQKRNEEKKSNEEKQTTEPPRGIINSGNICFMNSTLQCIYNLPSFRETVLTLNYSGTVFNQLKDIFKEMSKKEKTSINSKKLKEKMQQCETILNGIQQQDAHEFLLVLFAKISMETKDQHLNIQPKFSEQSKINVFFNDPDAKKLLDEDFLVPLFYNFLKVNYYSPECKHENSKIFNFCCFMLSICGSIQEIINKVNVDGNIRCPICKGEERPIETRVNTFALYTPQYLVFSLKRKVSEKEKDNYPVVINKEIDYHSKKYVLNSFIEHRGDSHGGHYFCYVKKQNDWYKCDDQKITYIKNSEMENILKDNTCVYMVFYERERAMIGKG